MDIQTDVCWLRQRAQPRPTRRPGPSRQLHTQKRPAPDELEEQPGRLSDASVGVGVGVGEDAGEDCLCLRQLQAATQDRRGNYGSYDDARLSWGGLGRAIREEQSVRLACGRSVRVSATDATDDGWTIGIGDGAGAGVGVGVDIGLSVRASGRLGRQERASVSTTKGSKFAESRPEASCSSAYYRT